MSTVQAVKVQDMINTELYAELSGVVSGSLEAELEIFNSMVALMPASLSVRGAQATIAKVEEDCGSLPSIKSSHTQDFINIEGEGEITSLPLVTSDPFVDNLNKDESLKVTSNQ